MLRSKLSLFISFVCLFQISFGQGKKQTVKSEKVFIIPFQLTEYNNLSVRAILNGKDTVNLMFHLAANAVALTEESVKKLKSLRFDATTDSIKSWGGQANSSRLSNSNTLQIGALTWEHVPIWEDENSGQHTDGKFGIDLFENKVIAIDFDKSIIEISTSLPVKAKTYEQLGLIFENDMMFLEADCEADKAVFKNKFLIHSGYAGDVLFDDKFANDNKLGDKLQIIGEKALKDSYGNILKTKKAILPVLKIGKVKLTNVPAGFFEGALGIQKMSIIGGDLLKRFNMIIDAERKYIYLKPGKLKDAGYTNI
jgi:Aspartyl protease